MLKESENILLTKTFDFAIRVVRLRKFLRDEQQEYEMSKQLLRSGTSIGANLREAVRAQTKADFLTKVYISYKEAGESEYWIDLLHATNYLTEAQHESLKADCVELLKLLSSTIKSTKREINAQ